MLTLTQRLKSGKGISVNFILSLTAEERTRTRYRWETPEGQELYLRLPRGTILNDGDLLQSQTGEIVVQIAAKPEPVLTITSPTSLNLLRAAYHLGNRHIPLEVTPDYLRLSPDPVLQGMLSQLGLDVKPEIATFQPEIGAYHHS